ncbi:hypothetical protein PTKIN_Ptkin12aG0160200 [Pterospermum kingtungense]
MDTYSSGEELVIKTRKPYTITKQRERWTEEEHNRFLEALKLYGRAWQRIEEHIGTKTAVQIRSHAQKFFSKLEKEALAKGVPISQALDIEIPPPRPKRKPSNPYPRKTGAATTAQVGAKDGKSEMLVSSLRCKQVLDLEKEPELERPNGAEKSINLKENQDESCSEELTLFHDGNCFSVSSVNKNSIAISAAVRNSCTFREFVPSLKEKIQDNDTSKASNMEYSCVSLEKSDQGQRKDDMDGALPTDEMQATQNYPRHVAVHVLDGSLGTCAQNPSLDMHFQDSVFHPMGDVHGQPNMFANPAASATTENQNNTPSSAHQNPAAHAAASFAATFWPYANIEGSADSPACSQGGFPSRQMNSAPSVSAITAATVAAATAWWAAHGLLPDQQLDPKFSEALQGQYSASKSPTSSSSDCEESGDAKMNTEVKAADDEKACAVTEPKDANKTKNKKPVDRSSCGSNTPSSSELETDMLEKHEKDDEDSKVADANHPQAECSNRRSRSCSNQGESWKEVSEEGRLAFQALFSRQVLPQSFSPPHEGKNKGQQKENAGEDEQNPDDKDGEASTLDLNRKAWESCSDHQEVEKNALSRGENIVEEGMLTIGLGHGKLKARRTGFKPYKRCSVEAKENRVMNIGNQGEEKGPKRIRLEGETAT